MMINKKGATQWTVAKLVQIVLLVVLLVMIIFGITSGGFTPLFEKVEGRINEVLLLVGVGESGDIADKGCRRGSVEDIIEGATGIVEVCRESCSFTAIEPEEFLGSKEFVLTAEGYKAREVGSEDLDDRDSWGSDSELSKLHRGAYQELKKVFDDFYFEKGKGVDREEFFAPLEFDSSSHFSVIVVPPRGVARSGEVQDLVFSWDGERWKRTVGEYSRFETETSDIFNESYDKYEYGYDVYWNYGESGVLNVPISGFNVNFKDVERSEEEFALWLNERTSEIDVEGNNRDGFYIEIEDAFRNTVYFYKEKQWRKDGLFINKKMGVGEILDGIFSAHQEGYEITWHYSKDEIIRVPVSDLEIISRKDIRSEKEFRRWFDGMRDDWTEDKEAQDDLLEEFFEYSGDGIFVDFEGERYLVETSRVFENERSYVLIYFDVGEDERFGTYYEEEEFVLIYGKGATKSVVSDWVGLGDSDWAEFLKINDIYEYLVEKCSV